MNSVKSALSVFLLAASAGAMAAEMSSDALRQQRMDESLQRYRDVQRNPQPGPVARAEESMKHGFHKAGAAVKHGARRSADAVKHGAHKAHAAAHRTGERSEAAKTPQS